MGSSPPISMRVAPAITVICGGSSPSLAASYPAIAARVRTLACTIASRRVTASALAFASCGCFIHHMPSTRSNTRVVQDRQWISRCVTLAGSSDGTGCGASPRSRTSSAYTAAPSAMAATARISRLRVDLRMSRPSATPPDRSTNDCQQQRQHDEKTQADHAERALRQLQLPVWRTLVGNVDQRVVLQQPVEHALAEVAVAAVAEKRIGQEVAVANHDHALLGLVRAWRQSAERDADVQRSGNLALVRIVSDCRRVPLLRDRAEARPGFGAGAQQRLHLPLRAADHAERDRLRKQGRQRKITCYRILWISG